ncbi:hypothetical protein EGJ00_13575 [Pseudomonas saudiphocaensis]|nr:hypothetical protein EGJ00_13575 [Pseudomonas saudiphocaensis]
MESPGDYGLKKRRRLTQAIPQADGPTPRPMARRDLMHSCQLPHKRALSILFTRYKRLKKQVEKALLKG